MVPTIWDDRLAYIETFICADDSIDVRKEISMTHNPRVMQRKRYFKLERSWIQNIYISQDANPTSSWSIRYNLLAPAHNYTSLMSVLLDSGRWQLKGNYKWNMIYSSIGMGPIYVGIQSNCDLFLSVHLFDDGWNECVIAIRCLLCWHSIWVDRIDYHHWLNYWLL